MASSGSLLLMYIWWLKRWVGGGGLFQTESHPMIPRYGSFAVIGHRLFGRSNCSGGGLCSSQKLPAPPINDCFGFGNACIGGAFRGALLNPKRGAICAEMGLAGGGGAGGQVEVEGGACSGSEELPGEPLQLTVASCMRASCLALIVWKDSVSVSSSTSSSESSPELCSASIELRRG